MAEATPKPKAVKTASSKADDSFPVFALVRRIVKVIALIVGGFLSIVSLMSVAGIVTGNGWVRLIIALIVIVGLSSLAVDRVLPKKAPRPRSAVTDIVSVVVMVIAFLFVGVGQPITKTLLVREADRMVASGFPFFARVVYVCAGVKVVTPGSK
jgi:D-alanyl-lipoteichoic acid acyltransferase DltB (MBOAT superfamily)